MLSQIVLEDHLSRIRPQWPKCPDCGTPDCWIYMSSDSESIALKCKNCGNEHLWYIGELPNMGD